MVDTSLRDRWKASQAVNAITQHEKKEGKLEQRLLPYWELCQQVSKVSSIKEGNKLYQKVMLAFDFSLIDEDMTFELIGRLIDATRPYSEEDSDE